MNYVQQRIDGGTLAFTVDGVTVTKQISRFTFRLDNYAGAYVGAYKLVASGCTNQANDGTYYFAATFAVTQSAGSLSIVANDSQGGTCTFPGDYTQSGRFGQSSGSFSCTNGVKGSHTLFEMNVTTADFRARLVGSDNFGCTLTGNVSGIRQ